MNLNLESMKPGNTESFSDIDSLLRLPVSWIPNLSLLSSNER